MAQRPGNKRNGQGVGAPGRMQQYNGGLSSTDDYAKSMQSNSSLLKTNFYHHTSGTPAGMGAGAGLHFGKKGNRREFLLSAKTRATPKEFNDPRKSMLS